MIVKKKTVLQIFETVLSLKDWHVFMTVTGDCERFHYFSFETLFLKN